MPWWCLTTAPARGAPAAPRAVRMAQTAAVGRVRLSVMLKVCRSDPCFGVFPAPRPRVDASTPYASQDVGRPPSRSLAESRFRADRLLCDRCSMRPAEAKRNLMRERPRAHRVALDWHQSVGGDMTYHRSR